MLRIGDLLKALPFSWTEFLQGVAELRPEQQLMLNDLRQYYLDRNFREDMLLRSQAEPVSGNQDRQSL